MMQFVIAYLSSAVAFAVLDFAWLSMMTPRLYRPQLGDLLREGVNGPPALAFYLIYVLGMTLLIVLPATSPMQALWRGALLGLTAYATYNLSNWATLRHWSASVAFTDMAWGAFATGVTCWIAATALGYFAR